MSTLLHTNALSMHAFTVVVMREKRGKGGQRGASREELVK